MLHEPSHQRSLPVREDMMISEKDKEILRKLGAQIADIAALPIHKEKAVLWTRLNDLDGVRPMVWINEIPWHEMNVDDELTLQCEHQWARNLEDKLRKTIYQWNHMPGDMVVNPYIDCPLIIHNSSFGITEDVDVVKTDGDNSVVSRHFNIQIQDPEDIEKIKLPKITYDKEKTDYTYQVMCDIFDGIIPVKKVGRSHIWFTPWDFLVRWWGVQESMMDLIMRPDMVHQAVEKMVDAWMHELDQYVEQNLLSLDCNNTRVGSGGYGYISDLPGKDYDPDHVKPHNMWGCSNAQIFSEVSPDMHWEFAIEHDLRWLSRWGHTYYGCCEPLDKKVHLLRKIPNLRKISVSPWCDTERAIHDIQNDYVISRKPNPAIFAGSNWSEKKAKADLTSFMEKTERQCHVELIMKDISTVNYKPQRLWEWEKIAMRVAEEFSR